MDHRAKGGAKSSCCALLIFYLEREDRAKELGNLKEEVNKSIRLLPLYCSCTFLCNPLCVMNPNYRRAFFLVWAYLNQPLFNRNRPLILNPRYFFYLCQIQYLERCFKMVLRSSGQSRNGADGSSH